MRRARGATHRLRGRLVHFLWAKTRTFGAIHPGSHRSEKFGSLGENSIIAFPPTAIDGERSIHIGAGTLVASWATLAAGYVPDDPATPDRALVIGDNCVIGLRSGIVAHQSVEIGNDVWLGQDVFITDGNHGYDDLDAPIGSQKGSVEPVSIGDNSWIGHGAIILAGTTIGRNAIVAAGAVVRGDVPDYSIAAGVPAKIVRFFGPGSESGPLH